MSTASSYFIVLPLFVNAPSWVLFWSLAEQDFCLHSELSCCASLLLSFLSFCLNCLTSAATWAGKRKLGAHRMINTSHHESDAHFYPAFFSSSLSSWADAAPTLKSCCSSQTLKLSFFHLEFERVNLKIHTSNRFSLKSHWSALTHILRSAQPVPSLYWTFYHFSSGTALFSSQKNRLLQPIRVASGQSHS